MNQWMLRRFTEVRRRLANALTGGSFVVFWVLQNLCALSQILLMSTSHSSVQYFNKPCPYAAASRVQSLFF
jgi:hypothetical protein